MLSTNLKFKYYFLIENKIFNFLYWVWETVLLYGVRDEEYCTRHLSTDESNFVIFKMVAANSKDSMGGGVRQITSSTTCYGQFDRSGYCWVIRWFAAVLTIHDTIHDTERDQDRDPIQRVSQRGRPSADWSSFHANFLPRSIYLG